MSSLITIFVIAVGLAMDAFAVSVAGGLKSQQAQPGDALKVGLFFGLFQGFMPLIGWLFGSAFRGLVAGVSGWIAFVLLTLIGLKMIKEAVTGDDGDEDSKSLLDTKTLLLMAIATSIDALVVGVTLNLVELPLIASVVVIGVVAFVLSVLGFQFGRRLGRFFAGKVEVLGGIILIGIGTSVLLS